MRSARLDLQVGSVGVGTAAGAVTALRVPTNAKAGDADLTNRPRARPCAHPYALTPKEPWPDGVRRFRFLMHLERRTGTSSP